MPTELTAAPSLPPRINSVLIQLLVNAQLGLLDIGCEVGVASESIAKRCNLHDLLLHFSGHIHRPKWNTSALLREC